MRVTARFGPLVARVRKNSCFPCYDSHRRWGTFPRCDSPFQRTRKTSFKRDQGTRVTRYDFEALEQAAAILEPPRRRTRQVAWSALDRRRKNGNAGSVARFGRVGLLRLLRNELIEHFAIGVQERNSRCTAFCNFHHQSFAALAVHERDRCRFVRVVADPDASRRFPTGFAVSHHQTSEFVVFIIHTCELHDLIGVVFVKSEAPTGIDDFAFRVAITTKDKPAVLGAFVVVKKHTRLWTLEGLFFSAH